MRYLRVALLTLGFIGGTDRLARSGENTPASLSTPSAVGQVGSSAPGWGPAGTSVASIDSRMLPVIPATYIPEAAISSAWDDGAESVLTTELQPVPPQSYGAEVDALRLELRQAVGQLQTAQQQLQQTREQLAAQQGSADDDKNDDGSTRLKKLETAFDTFRKQLSKEGAGNAPTARLTGFTQLDDYGLYQDPLNKATVGTGQNGVGFRRARVAIVGNVAEFTAYMVEVDFATAGRPSFFDVWTEQENIPYFGAVRAGQYLQPFSADAQSGFRNLPFLERSLPFLAFVPFRRVGAMASNNTLDERTYWAYSVFKTGGFNNAPVGDSRFATDIGNQGGYSFSTRVTHLLWYDEPSQGRYLWHIGAAYDLSGMTAAPGSTSGSSPVPFYQARTGPEFGPIGDGIDTAPSTFGPASYAGSNTTPPNFIDTGRYQAKSFNLMGLETVYQHGAFSAQSEFMATEVNSIVGPLWYTGAYGEVMYRLTGESRGYDKRLGALKNVTPFTDFISLKRGRVVGWGAWEVAARLSYVDLRNPSSLNGHYLSGTNASGNGTLTDSTLGLTWFMNAHTKLQMNWIHAFLNNTSTVAGTAHGYSQANFIVSRLQVDF
jgi:phosphate-selective porin OprO/OprP